MPHKKPTLALLGAGIFVRSDYVPCLRELSDIVTLRAIWSRSKKSAQSVADLVKDFSPDVLVKWGEDGLKEIFLDETIDSVSIVLSATIQLEIVQRALEAGKHVLQEKPVGTCVSEVRDVFATYKSLSSSGGKPIWAVAENFRFETAMNEAASWVKEIGELTCVQVTAYCPMTEDSSYFESAKTSWRKDFEGGFPLDGGVHFVAATKMITGSGIKSVAAIVRHTDSKLPPPDTVETVLRFNNGFGGLLVMSWNGSLKAEVVWRVLGSKGEVRVELTTQNGKAGYQVQLIPVKGTDKKSNFHPISGVLEELRTFATDVSNFVFEGMDASSADPRSSVEQAINDVAVIEAIFKSSAIMENFTQVEELHLQP
ncbi:unnamed protein product [Calypogeia fissa]